MIHNCFKYKNENISRPFEINNICIHENGLVLCLLTNTEIKIYERYSSIAKFKIEVLNKFNNNNPNFVKQINFLKKGEYLICSATNNLIYIYNFISFRLFRKIAANISLSVRSVYLKRHENNILILTDQNKSENIILA